MTTPTAHGGSPVEIFEADQLATSIRPHRGRRPPADEITTTGAKHWRRTISSLDDALEENLPTTIPAGLSLHPEIITAI